jgi:cyclopropane-fatty-acyl-phospholipid synthase
MFPLTGLLQRLIRTGTLHVIDAQGRRHSFCGTPTPEVAVRFNNSRLPWEILFRPELAVGEGYMDGRLTLEGSESVFDFLSLVTKNMEWNPANPNRQRFGALTRFKGWLTQRNAIAQAKRNVAHHYDLSDELYNLFLDPARQYSCAYFKTPGDTLAEAQQNKMALIAKKLRLEPGMSVLEIGSGWGGLALYLHRTAGARVTGITLSAEQLKYAETRARAAGADKAVEFRYEDYREVKGTYDRAVSVGMFEGVGRGNFGAFFGAIRDRLTDDGVALLHTIGRADGPGITDLWTLKYIFPGGYVPALSEILPDIERAGLYITDLEVWRLHYARTLAAWRQNCFKHRKAIEALYDPRFFRMWDFYLSSAECAFRNLGHVVFQIQLAKRQDAAPLTRDYLLQK